MLERTSTSGGRRLPTRGPPSDVKAGIRLGLKFARVYSIGVLVGAIITRGTSLAYFHQPVYIVIGFYFIGAVVVGGLGGLLGHYAKTRLAASVIGFLLAIPVELSILVIFRPTVFHPDFPRRVVIIATIAFALIYGCGYGAILWRPRRR
jgi:hypothetical protein